MTRTQAKKARRIFRKAWKFTFGTVALIGGALVLGTVGSSDLDLIPFSQIVTQSLIGTAMLGGGLALGGFLEW